MTDDNDALWPATASTRSKWGSLLAAYWIVLFTATHLPPNVPIVPGTGGDKLAHVLAYATLAFLIASYWQAKAGWLGREHYFWIVILCAAFGVVDELLQIPVGRYASTFDWVADLLGAILGVGAFAIWNRFRRPHSPDQ